MYISYIPSPWLEHLKIDVTLNNCLFGSVKLTKNADPNKNSGYGIGFDSRSEFSFTDRSMEKMLLFCELI